MELSVAEIARYLRMGDTPPDATLAARIVALRDAVNGVLRPARVWRRIALPYASESRDLSRHLAGCTSAFLVCGTLGAGFDAFLRRVSVTSGADALIVQAVGTAAIERWMDRVADEIRAECAPDEALRPRYSPGYGDFPLAAQRALLTELDAARRIGVSLTDTLLMVPSKSVSAVIGVGPASVRAIVSLGSNIEPRADFLARARTELAALPGTRLVRVSSVIETDGVDVPDEFADRKFLNQVLILETALAPYAFSRAMHAIEDRLGRVRTVRNGPRTIDIDLIDFGGLASDDPELTLPHPRAREREFVMRPLAELQADFGSMSFC